MENKECKCKEGASDMCKYFHLPTQEPMELIKEFLKEFPLDDAGCDGCAASRAFQIRVQDWWLSQIKQAEERVKKEIEDKCAESFYPYCGGDKEGDISYFNKLQIILKNL